VKIVLTGEPGSGKTTVVKKVAGVLGEKAMGFWTEEVRDPRTGKRTGFKVVTTEGKEVLFASKRFTSRKLVGSYGVNVERFESIAVPVLERALKEKGKVTLVDEVGKMELFSKRFRDLISDLISLEGRKLLITIPIRDVHPLVRRIRRLEGAVLIEVGPHNRDVLPEDLIQLLGSS
jgi:nucleoside-triphosphatase